MKKYNILIVHAHWNNRGDEAAIRAMVDSLKEKLPIEKIRIMIMSEEINYFPYEEIELIPDFPSKRMYYIDAFLNVITFGRFSLTKRGRAFLKAVKESDLVIHAHGGPSIGDLYGGRSFDLLYLYRLFVIEICNKKPLFFYAPSIGPFNGKIKNLIRKLILKKAKLIVIREQISADYLKEQMGLNCYVTFDSVLQNKIPENYVNKYKGQREFSKIWDMVNKERVVGVTITDLRWHSKYVSNVELQEMIINSLVKVSQYLVKKDYRILLIPQIFNKDYEKIEKDLLCKIQKINDEKIYILPLNIDSFGIQMVVSRLFSVIGMRSHSVLFAVKGRTPFISIPYEHKMEGFLNELELRELMIRVEEISSEKIIDKFEYIENNYNSIKNRLEIKVPMLMEKSKKTTDLILESIKNLE